MTVHQMVIYKKYRCTHCRNHCIFCDKKIRNDQSDTLGSCRSCWSRNLKEFLGGLVIPEVGFFEKRLRKKKLGAHQKEISNKIGKHFNIIECYRISNFLIDMYLEDLGLYIIFKNREFIIKNNPKFGMTEEEFIRRMEVYGDAFKQSTGHEITYVFVDELIKQDEEELVRYFSELAKSHKKISGEFFI